MTKTKVPTIQHIEKDGDYGFVIGWSDGMRRRYRLADLQRRCPCASCVDHSSGERIHEPKATPDDLTASRLHNVGRYGLRIDFHRGCSNGIFGFDKLYDWGEQC